MTANPFSFGRIALLGSGETAPTSGAAYDWITAPQPTPLRIALLETPAGFEPNAERVARRVADFLQVRLQNAKPQICQIAARKRGSETSPDNPALMPPLEQAAMIFLGPGSPTYAVRQLAQSLAWYTMLARVWQGAALATASAGTLALSAFTLPVYEIYKVGEDLHWKPGLDFFEPFGLKLALVPHWNNSEGGAELDTSHCYMGRERFAELRAQLDDDTTIVGIDEHTALAFDLANETCQVLGRGDVTIIANGREETHTRNSSFPISALGPFHLPTGTNGIPTDVWARCAPQTVSEPATPSAPAEVVALAEQRQQARARRDFAAADSLRKQLGELGWLVRDTPNGPELEPA